MTVNGINKLPDSGCKSKGHLHGPSLQFTDVDLFVAARFLRLTRPQMDTSVFALAALIHHYTTGIIIYSLCAQMAMYFCYRRL
jgi:hypothetical protein